MTQLSFSDAEHAGKRKQTRRELFLAEMEHVVPWTSLLAQIAPHYPKSGRGRQPYALETMLRDWSGTLLVAVHDEVFLRGIGLTGRLHAGADGWCRLPP